MCRIFYLLVLSIAILSVESWPRKGKSQQPKETSFVGTATNELSTAILQSYIDDGDNLAFSPLGYAAILAILAEGARGETKQQLVSSLHLPDDNEITRKTFHFIMERLKFTNRYEVNKPELKNFFYIYKNYTINDDFKKILEDHYLTEVRIVEKYIEPADKTEEEASAYAPVKAEVPKDEDKSPENLDSQIVISYSPPVPKPVVMTDYATTPQDEEKQISFAVEDKPVKVEDIPIELQYKPAKNIKEKIKLVKSSQQTTGYGTEEEETMIADEARIHARSGKSLFGKNDISSSLSVNSVGKKVDKVSDSLMLLFNGMYFRGAWKKPFDKEELGTFYKSESEKIQVPMLKSRGKYKSGVIPGLDSNAIELPYDGGRYALTLVIPRARDGLIRLIADLPDASLADIHSSLIEEELDVSIPSFFVEITTKPVSALAKFGVSSIFSPSADLSGISTGQGLFVQEMVQHVSVKVDNSGSTATEFGANNLVAPKEATKSAGINEDAVKKFSVEHPFVFFIHDVLDNLVVVAGKVSEPKQQEPFFGLSAK